MVGHLTSATLLGADGAHSLAGAQAPKAEPEIVIEIGPDKTIAGLGPAIELVDIPAPPSGPDDVPEVVATNIFHRGVAIGSSAAVESPAGARGPSAWTARWCARATPPTTRSPTWSTRWPTRWRPPASTWRPATGSSPARWRRRPTCEPGQRLKLDLGPLGAIEVQLTV